MNQDVFEGKWKEMQGPYVLFASTACWIFPLYRNKHGRIILLR